LIAKTVREIRSSVMILISCKDRVYAFKSTFRNFHILCRILLQLPVSDALEMLENYDWQGNFRELHNFAVRLAVECFDESVISRDAAQKILGDRIKQIGLNRSEGAEKK
jgi:transcriptional regulator with AAA-type ATPase domain